MNWRRQEGTFSLLLFIGNVVVSLLKVETTSSGKEYLRSEFARWLLRPYVFVYTGFQIIMPRNLLEPSFPKGLCGIEKINCPRSHFKVAGHTSAT